MIVTALSATSSSDCKTTANHAHNIKELVHYDILSVDNSVNAGETLEKPVDEEGKPLTIVGNCGDKAVLFCKYIRNEGLDLHEMHKCTHTSCKCPYSR